MKDIFDLTDTSDLPEDMLPKKSGGTKGKKLGPRVTRLEALLREAGRPCNARELAAAIYRKYGTPKQPKHLRGWIANLRKQGRVVQVAPGLYSLPEHANVTPIKRA
jgi:hypothetical protein